MSYLPKLNSVRVCREEDLPAVSGGVHTLAAKVYEIDGTVSLAAPIQMVAGSVVIGTSPSRDIIVYSGSGAAVRFGNATAEIAKVTIVGTGSNDGVSVAGSTNEASINGCVITNVVNAISINGCAETYVIDISMRTFSTGIRIEGTNTAVLCTRCQYRNTSTGWKGVYYAGGTTQVIALYDGYYSAGNGSGTALVVESGIDVGRRGIYTGNVLDGDVTVSTGIDESNAKWQYQASGGVYDSRSLGYLYWNDNASATDVVSQNTWYKATGTNTGSTYERMTVANNRLTYKDSRRSQVRIDVNVSLFTASNNQTLSVGVAKNGSVVGAVTTVRADSANQRYPASVRVVTYLTADDYVEVWVRNQTGTADITVEDMQMDAFR